MTNLFPMTKSILLTQFISGFSKLLKNLRFKMNTRLNYNEFLFQVSLTGSKTVRIRS